MALSVKGAVVDRCLFPLTEFGHSELDQIDSVDMVLSCLVVVVRSSQKVCELKIGEVSIAINCAKEEGQLVSE